MPKINQEEYEVLKELDDKYKWIARDEDRGLYALTKKPVKKDGPSSYWWDADPYSALGLIDEIHLFQFIQWEDESPYNIQELIEEYLYDNQPKLFIDGQEQSFEFIEESEEKEVKDLEWAKNEIENLYSLTFDAYRAAFKANNEHFEKENSTQLALISKVLELVDQLDEPEVLSQKWIDEHKESWQDLSITGYSVPEKDLQNLLVPKQEEVDRAYKDGYEEGKQHGFYKGYREGLANKGGEPETVADVVTTFWKSYERLKEVMSMEVKELEE